MLTELVAFIGVSVVVICTPGPDTALTVRNAFAGGRRSGVWTGAGVAAGQLVWTVAACAGIASVIAASEPAFLILKVSGSAYLVYLGGQSLWAAWRDRGHSGPDPAPGSDDGAIGPAGPQLGPGRAFRQGVLNNLANPKMAAFFLSLLPQFVPEGRGSVAAYLPLGLLFCLMTFAWLAAYSAAVARARRLLGRAALRRALDAVSGCVLIAFGARLVLQER